MARDFALKLKLLEDTETAMATKYKTRCDKGKKRLFNNKADSLYISRAKYFLPCFRDWIDIFCHERYGHWSYYIEPKRMKEIILAAEEEGVKVYQDGQGGYYTRSVPNRTFRAYPIKTAEGIKTLYNITALLVAMGLEYEDYDPEELCRL